MTDVRDLGRAGQTTFTRAEELKGAKLINEAEFKELTNDKVGPQDLAIADRAFATLDKTRPDNAVALGRGILSMKSDILKMQGGGLLDDARKLGGALLDKAAGFASDVWKALSTTDTRDLIRNIKA